MDEPVASGRDAELFDAGPGRLLRRTRTGRSIAREAEVMRWAREHDVPVPEIYDVSADGTEIVMERVDGPLMAEAIMRRPWQTAAFGRLLADLLDRIHAVPPPDGLRLPRVGNGDHFLHLDFHPLNVIMGSRGPVVIDWSNAAVGDRLIDVGITYVLLTCPRMPGPAALNVAARPARLLLARAFARRYRGGAFDECLAFAAELKALDAHLDAAEVSACVRLATRARARSREAAG